MDQHLEETTQWFTSLGIENVNIDKLKRQLSIITLWFNRSCKGVVQAVTGFGKTYIAIIAIHRLNKKYPDATTIVVVPTIKLSDDWKEHITTFDLKNVSVYVVNSYTQNYVKTNEKYKCAMLVVDEVHRVLGQRGILFNKTIKCTECDMLLGLTATLDPIEESTLIELRVPVIDNVTMLEAKRFGYISDYVTYNLGITLSPESQEIYDRFNDIHNSNLGKFRWFVDRERDWELIRACQSGRNVSCKVGTTWRTGQEWREWYAGEMGWDGDPDHPWSPKNINKYAQQWAWAMKERKDFLYNSQDKIRACVLILRKFGVPAITFAETTAFVDDLVREIGKDARAYHSNIKTEVHFKKETVSRNAKYLRKFLNREGGKAEYNDETGKFDITYEKPFKVSGPSLRRKIMHEFEKGLFKYLCTAKALDEGLDIRGIELAVICSATSKRRNTIQRNGRALRFKPDKVARIINLYIKGTQDEVWLKRRQKGEPDVIWVESIDNIE